MNRVALVIGVAHNSSIGAAVCRKLADKDFYVVSADLQAISNEIPSDEHHCIDITDEKAVEILFDELAKTGVTPVILVNCAGMNVMGSVEDVSVDDFRRVINVNLVSNFILLKEWAKWCKNSTPKTFIAITSDTGMFIPKSNSTSYASSKAGANGFIMSAAREFNKYRADENWVITALALGRVANTPMDMNTRRQMCDSMNISMEEADDKLSANIPLGRGMYPKEVADWVYFLTTAGAEFASGAVLRIDGGQLQG